MEKARFFQTAWMLHIVISMTDIPNWIKGTIDGWHFQMSGTDLCKTKVVKDCGVPSVILHYINPIASSREFNGTFEQELSEYMQTGRLSENVIKYFNSRSYS